MALNPKVLEDFRQRQAHILAGGGAEKARAGAMEKVSEVDLTEAKDLRATISDLQSGSALNGSPDNQWAEADAPIVVHFGDSDFENRFYTVLKDYGDWRAKTGRIESVDLRFNGEAVVNPDRTLVAQARDESPSPAASKPAHSAAPKKSARHSR